MNKKRIFSGIQPSGEPHIGNYLGAIKNWVNLQDEFESIFCIVDLHAITVPQDPEELRKKTLEVAKVYLAAGIDPEKSIIFVQSRVKEHSELAWILNCITQNGDLTKMTQFKSKSGSDFDELEKSFESMRNPKNMEFIGEKEEKFIKENNLNNNEIVSLAIGGIHDVISEYFRDFKNKFNGVGVGLFDYPVLQAADILLYNTEVVPVGEDQVQHVELTRTIARRFNKRFGETLIVPKSYTRKEGMRVMGLDNPENKMSKSAPSEYNYISLLDTPEAIEKKIKKAVTDSGSDITYSEDRPAIKNLINIYASFSGLTPEEIVAKYEGKGFGDFKQGLTKSVLDFIIPFQEKYSSLKDEDVLNILRDGAKKASVIAEEKMVEVKNKVGFLG
ncbi:tryptophan--tRNA ligase [Patescibacteria group bacterium]